MRMLDLFAGRLGWGKAFLARGWEVTAFDLVAPPEVPEGVLYLQLDVLRLGWLPGSGLVYSGPDGKIWELGFFDFICASSPCEQFSVHGMKHFHPNPPYPEMGIKLFNHTRALCEAVGVPYVMENVRAAQQFVGRAVHHCGPFYLWGTGVPPILPQGVIKGWETKHHMVNGRWVGGGPGRGKWSTSDARKQATAKVATIPPELAGAVADYATRLCEVTA